MRYVLSLTQDPDPNGDRFMLPMYIVIRRVLNLLAALESNAFDSAVKSKLELFIMDSLIKIIHHFLTVTWRQIMHVIHALFVISCILRSTGVHSLLKVSWFVFFAYSNKG